MKVNLTSISSWLAIVFGLLSMFSIWNIYNWDILGWGTKLFLFPFLAVIAFFGRLTSEQSPTFIRIQLGLLLLHGVLYFLVFNFQDPHAPNLLLLVVALLLSSIVLIFSKVQSLGKPKKHGRIYSFEKQIKALLLLSGTFYLGMGILANPQLLLPGIILELSALLMYLYHLIRP
jgi:hypothetical protein